MVPVGQHLANLRGKGGLGKGLERAAKRAQQLTAIDEDWNCPWPLDWLRHYRVLADLVDADGVLPYIASGVVFEGDDLGKWLQRQRNPGTWTQLSTEQQRPVEAGRTAQPDAHTRPCDQPRGEEAGQGAAGVPARAGGPHAVGRTGRHGRPVRRGHSEGISVKGETEPVVVKLGVWISNTKSRRDRLDTDHLATLATLGMNWAGPLPVPDLKAAAAPAVQPAPHKRLHSVTTTMSATRPPTSDSAETEEEEGPVMETGPSSAVRTRRGIAAPTSPSPRTEHNHAHSIVCPCRAQHGPAGTELRGAECWCWVSSDVSRSGRP